MACKFDPIFKLGDSIILKLPSGNTKLVKLEAKASIDLGKFGKFKPQSLVGKPYGQCFEILEGGELQARRNVEIFDIDFEDGYTNNQDIFDSNMQKMSYEEIEELKKKNKGGYENSYEIIKVIAENNESFDKKTEYSKSKYIKRKEKKFVKQFMPQEPNIYNICEHFFKKNPEKINYLRSDTLSQILNLSNVYDSSRTLVFENTQGLIAGGLLSRTTTGVVYGLHEGTNNNYDVLNHMNLSESQLSVLHTLSWTSIDHELEPFSEHLPDDACEGHAKGHARRKRAHETLAKNLTEFRKEPFDGLVISTNYDVTSVVKALLKYIGGSRTVVVYSPYKETLTGCFDYMRASSEFVNVQITESWLREYQVLPGRTHPFMTMSGSGGYILTAIRIFSSFVPSNTRAK